MSIKKITLDFAKTTSMKGVPKIMQSQRTIFRRLWIVAVMLLLSICIQQCYLILNEYFSYPKTTTLYEEAIPYDNLDELNMPDVLLCNLNPFNSEATDIDDIPSAKEYLQIVENMTSTDPIVQKCNSSTSDCVKQEMRFYLR